MINIQENDILWKGWIKLCVHANEGKVTHPQNLCTYFWGSLFGFISIFALEAGLATQYLLATTFGLAFFGGLTPSLLELPTLILFIISAVVALSRTFLTLSSFEYPKWFCFVLFWSFLIFSVGFLLLMCGLLITSILSAVHEKGFQESSNLVAHGVGWTVIVAALLAITIWAVIHFFKLEVIGRFFSQIWELCCAMKSRMCPLVKTPDSWVDPDEPGDEPEADEKK